VGGVFVFVSLCSHYSYFQMRSDNWCVYIFACCSYVWLGGCLILFCVLTSKQRGGSWALFGVFAGFFFLYILQCSEHSHVGLFGSLMLNFEDGEEVVCYWYSKCVEKKLFFFMDFLRKKRGNVFTETF